MAFFRYPGGKKKLFEIVRAELLKQCSFEDLEYREPFWGGGGVGIRLIEKHKEIKKLWINDWDSALCCLWYCVLQYKKELIAKIKDFTPSVEAFYQYKSELSSLQGIDGNKPLKSTEIIELGFKKLVIHQLSYSGLGTMSGGPLGGVKQASKYKIDCRWSPKTLCNKIEKIHALLVQVEYIKCTNKDFTEIIDNYDNDAIIYLDPPYYEQGANLYQHSFTEVQHTKLAESLKNCGHKWILSYDDCEPIRNLYSWARIISFDVGYSITATKEKDSGKRLSTTKKELIICPA